MASVERIWVGLGAVVLVAGSVVAAVEQLARKLEPEQLSESEQAAGRIAAGAGSAAAPTLSGLQRLSGHSPSPKLPPMET